MRLVKSLTGDFAYFYVSNYPFLGGEEHLIDDAFVDRERWNSHRTFVWFVITSSKPINFFQLILYWLHKIQSCKSICFTIGGRPNEYFCIRNDQRFRRPWRLIEKSPRTQKWELRTWDGVRQSGRCFRRKTLATKWLQPDETNLPRPTSNRCRQPILLRLFTIAHYIWYKQKWQKNTDVPKCFLSMSQQTNYHYPVATLLAMENKNSSMTSSIPYNRIITTIWDVNRPLYLLIFSWVF